MADWKKVVVSGSSGVELNSITLKGTAGTIVNNSTVAGSKLTGSFSGSFTGDGSGLTGVASTLQTAMAGGSTTSIAITSSAGTMLSGSGDMIIGGDVTIGTSNTTNSDLVVAGGTLQVKKGTENILKLNLNPGFSTGGAVAVGYRSLGTSQGQNQTTAVGRESGRNQANSDDSVFIGYQAGGSSGTGDADGSTFVGSQAGFSTKTKGNTFIGHGAGYDVASGTNNIIIGSGSVGEAATTSQLRIGNNSVTAISGSLTTGDLIFANTASAPNFSGSFQGDGSGLTGVTAAPETLQATMAAGSSTSVAITSSAGTMLSGSGEIHSGVIRSGAQINTGSFGMDISTNKFIVQNGGEDLKFIDIDGDQQQFTIDGGNVGVSVRIGTNSAIANSGLNIGTSIGTSNAMTLGVGQSDTDLILKVTGSANVKGSVTAPHFTGSLKGNADTATTANTASYVAGANVDGTVANATLAATANALATNATGTNLVLGGNLSVAGTASFVNSTNLSITDKYILLSSGSTSAGDGGFVVQQAAGGVGQLFAFDSATSRWGITGSFDADTAGNFTPKAFMSQVVTSDVADYRKSGNIRVESGEIYIYVE